MRTGFAQLQTSSTKAANATITSIATNSTTNRDFNAAALAKAAIDGDDHLMSVYVPLDGGSVVVVAIVGLSLDHQVPFRRWPAASGLF